MKSGGPLLGYNNNIPYKGEVYHVQTEDSGAKRPHVITHLFADGGRIVKTRKTSYADLVDEGTEDLEDRVRSLMREQHKGMVISLRDGELDHLIDPDPSSPPDPSEVVEEIKPPPPSAPLDLLERAAAMDESAFEDEVERVATDRPVPPVRRTSPNPAAGTYRFVGDRDDAPPKEGTSASRRRMRRTSGGAATVGGEVSPGAADAASAAVTRKRPPPPRRPRSQPPLGLFGRPEASPPGRLDALIEAYRTRSQ
ncbi:MAG: hypothetical protein AAGA56_07185 [Myxococcota bacterium]